MSQYAVEVVENRIVVTVVESPVIIEIPEGGAGSGSSGVSRARLLNFQSGTQEVTWTFATPLTGSLSDYVPTAALYNIVDGAVAQDLVVKITAFSLTAITVYTNAPTDSGNYAAAVHITQALNP